MRFLSWALVLIMLFPAVSAVTWEDPADDHEMGRGTHRETGDAQMHWIPLAGTGRYENVDILSASIDETEADLIFSVSLTTTEPDSDASVGPTGFFMPDYFQYQYLWKFTFKGEELYAGFTDWARFDFTYFSVFTLVERDGFTWQNNRMFVIPEENDEGEGWTAVVPKWRFRDADLVPIREGDRLEDLTFFATEGDDFGGFGPCPDSSDPMDDPFSDDCHWTVRDRIQDGASLGTFTVEQSPPGVGHLFMRIDKPIRQSNGLATTYLFEAQVHNLEPDADSFFLQVSGIPDGWEVHLPPVVDFSGEGKETVPVAVTVPFQHEHGVSHIMELTAVSERDPDSAMTSLFGVVFADPPQPAGHHDTLFFHSDEDGNWGWMNTRLTEPQATKQPIRAWNFGNIDTTYQASWTFGLNPNLAIGLDFDMSKAVESVFTLMTPVDVTDATVEASLYLYEWEADQIVTIAKGSTTAQFTGEEGQEFRLDLDLQDAADRLPYEPRRNLFFKVNITGEAIQIPNFFDRGQGSQPEFDPSDASIKLPLFDYHDEVDLSGLSLSVFSIQALNGSFRGVNPGNTTVFAYNITNLSDKQYTIDWEIRGDENYASWASLKPATTHVAPGGTSSIVLRVKAPLDAADGDAAEYLLVGRVKEKTDLQVFARATAMVVTGFPIPDESAMASDLERQADKVNDKNKKESPGPALVLVGLGLLVLARRRR